MFCLNRKHNLKRHNINYLDWPFRFKVNLKGSSFMNLNGADKQILFTSAEIVVDAGHLISSL